MAGSFNCDHKWWCWIWRSILNQKKMICQDDHSGIDRIFWGVTCLLRLEARGCHSDQVLFQNNINFKSDEVLFQNINFKTRTSTFRTLNASFHESGKKCGMCQETKTKLKTCPRSVSSFRIRIHALSVWKSLRNLLLVWSAGVEVKAICPAWADTEIVSGVDGAERKVAD